MVMEISQLVESFPRLYHMAWGGSWPSIKKNGLHSTDSLLQLYDVPNAEKRRILEEHRPECVEIIGKNLGKAVVRDQKPMSNNGVTKALGQTATPQEWYKLLNSMVFFWPTTGRLKTMLSARSYREIEHDVLVVRTEPLIKKYLGEVRLSPINSGCTKPYPHPRSPDIFYPLGRYPYDDRLKRVGKANAVAEVCVQRAVPDIENYVEKVITMKSDDFGKYFHHP
jgi:hypothetical protein